MTCFPRVCALIVALSAVPVYGQGADAPTVPVGDFNQEVAHAFTTADGLPSNDVQNVTVDEKGVIYAATAGGLARSVAAGTAFESVKGFEGMAVQAVCALADTLLVVHSGAIYDIKTPEEPLVILPPEARAKEGLYRIVRAGNRIYISTAAGLYRYAYRDDLSETPLLQRTYGLEEYLGDDRAIQDIAVSGKGDIAVAANGGLFYSYDVGETWKAIYPSQGDRSWAPQSVGGVAFNGDGNLWFGAKQGAGVLTWDWTLYTGEDGLPFNDFTCATVDQEGRPWFGTTMGAVYFTDGDWRYRQGKRWLPGDAVRAIAVDGENRVWLATAEGLGRISWLPMTLAQKAKYYEDEIDAYHRRTPYEYVLEVSVATPGVKEDVRQHDSDNDGLWTSMYGAGECFAYGATGGAKAKERAIKAFTAMEFLGTVSQGGSNPAPTGYVARTILPTDGPNPNDGRLENDKREQLEDSLWKVYEPRWPTSEDGAWYWKSDTSSDELDGHYFLYGAFYDLVADTEELRERVRVHVANLTNHLIDHGYNLVDHDGTPTRWARYSPEEVNFSKNWFVERGLNSLSMLSYLRTTAHITGDTYFNEMADKLIADNGYAQNLMYPKYQHGVGTGNQSDDEMAFMAFYNLIKYEPDADLKSRFALSFWQYWRLEQPELNPFFNYAFAAQAMGKSFTDPWGVYPLDPTGDWLDESVDTLKRFPLDRFDWALKNSHRIDVVELPGYSEGFDRVGSHKGRALRTTGFVLPVDERHFNHWNTDPFDLDYGGAGASLADGAVYLLPYYMGLYHGFITETGAAAE